MAKIHSEIDRGLVVCNKHIGMYQYPNQSTACHFFTTANGKPVSLHEIRKRFSDSTVDDLLLKIADSPMLDTAYLDAGIWRQIIRLLQRKLYAQDS